MRARGLFVAEGRLVVERLIAEGRYAIQSLLLSEAACRALEPALGALEPSVPIYICEAPDFRVSPVRRAPRVSGALRAALTADR